MCILVSVSSGGRAAVFTFVIADSLTAHQLHRLAPYSSAAGVKGQVRLQAGWFVHMLQVDKRAGEGTNDVERRNASVWVEVCLGVRDGNISSRTLLTFSCT